MTDTEQLWTVDLIDGDGTHHAWYDLEGERPFDVYDEARTLYLKTDTAPATRIAWTRDMGAHIAHHPGGSRLYITPQTGDIE